MKHSEAAKQKISKALAGHKTKGMTGQHHSEETKQKLRRANKGQVPWSKGKKWSVESRQKLSISATGRVHSEETKQKISISKKGTNKGIPRPAHVLAAFHSAEARAKAAASRTGTKRSKETKQKQSIAATAREARKREQRELQRYPQHFDEHDDSVAC